MPARTSQLRCLSLGTCAACTTQKTSTIPFPSAHRVRGQYCSNSWSPFAMILMMTVSLSGTRGGVLPFHVVDDVLPAEIGGAWVRLGPAPSLGKGSSLSLVSSGPLCGLLLGPPWGGAPCALTATAVVGA